MIGFTDDHREVYGVEPICRVLTIAPSTYHDDVAARAYPAKAAPRTRRDEALRAAIRRVYEANFRDYGVRKVWRQLTREGESLGTLHGGATDEPARSRSRQASEDDCKRQSDDLC